MKKILSIAAMAAVVVGFASAAFAQSETNVSHGITNTTDNTLGAQAFRERTATRPDWSRYSTTDNRDGCVMRNYDYILDGINTSAGFTNFVMASNTFIDVKGRSGYRIPSNTIVYGYVLEIVQAASTPTQTFALGLNAAGDLLAASTNFGVVHRRAAAINPAIKATNDVFLLLSSDAGVSTSLEFNVWLNTIYAP